MCECLPAIYQDNNDFSPNERYIQSVHIKVQEREMSDFVCRIFCRSMKIRGQNVDVNDSRLESFF